MGQKPQPNSWGAVFSLQAPDIHKAHSELKLRGAKVDDEVTKFGPQSLGFHVIDSEGNVILIIDGAS